MAFGKALGLAVPFEDFPGFFLKSFQQGTTTPISMATDATGGTLLAKAEVSSGGAVPIGFFKTAGGAIFVPHLEEAYDSWLFPTAEEADANDTTNATQIADNLLVTVATDDGAIAGNVVSYLPAGTGAILTTVRTKLREAVSAPDFGADKTGATNTSAAVQLAINFASSIGAVLYFPAGTYDCQDGLTGLDNLTLFGDGNSSVVTMGVNGLEFTDKSDIYISRIHWQNDGTDEVIHFIGCSSTYVGYNKVTQPTGAGGGNVALISHSDSATQGGQTYVVEYNELHGNSTSCIFFQAAASREMSDIKVHDNFIYGDNMPTGNECQAIKLDLHCNDYEIINNYIDGEQTSGGNVVIVMGVAVEEDVINGKVKDNVITFCGGGIRIFDGQGGLRVDNLECSGNTIRDLFNYGTGIGGGIGISVAGDVADSHIGLDIHHNFIDGCTDGIQFSDGAAEDVDVNYNTVRNATGDSFLIVGDTVRFSGNTSRNAGGRGFSLSGCDNLIGSDNKAYDSTTQSLRIFNCKGVKLANSYFEASNAKTEEVSISGGTGFHELIGGAVISGATNGISVFGDADGVGTRIDVNDIQNVTGQRVLFSTGAGAVPVLTIASGSVTITNDSHQIAPESGTADTLSTIVGGYHNQILTLSSDTDTNTITVDEAGNIKLAGSFVMDDSDDRLTLRYNAAFNFWSELSRADNA